MSSILVTGGYGFIGSRLVDKLVSTECQRIVVYDKIVIPERFKDIGKISVVKGEISDVEKLKRITSAFGVDYIFHMAVLPLIQCEGNPRECLETNVIETFNVLEAAKDAKVKKVIFSSASSVYGDTLKIMNERHPLNARTWYGMSKIMGEELCKIFYQMYGLNYIALRYMNVYGEGQNGGIIVNTIKSIRQEIPPKISGDGSQSFDFVHVDDVVKANILAMASHVTGETFNIGGENEVTIKDLVETILGLADSTLKPEYKLDDRVVVQRRVGSSKKAKRMLGYVPSISLIDGLKRMIDKELKGESSHN